MNINLTYLSMLLIIIPLFVAGLLRISNDLLNHKLTTIISITAASVIFLMVAYLTWYVFMLNLAPINIVWYTWGAFGDLNFNFGCWLDQTSIVMLCVITGLSLIIQIYSIVFMQNEANYVKYFSYISFFNFAIILLIIANNFLQLFFGWELVGVGSYWLINFWFKSEIVNRAAFKVFFINRIGNVSLLLVVILILKKFNSLAYQEIFANLINLKDLTNINLIIGLLVLAVLIKSAQVPFQVWLPDAMEGPLPIAVLLQTATMVGLGVFILIRISPLLQFSVYWLNLILLLGITSALLASLLALMEVDFKCIMAYSTISQIGLMLVAIGCSAYYVSMLHLIIHALSKSLLFLSGGAIFYAMNNRQANLHNHYNIGDGSNINQYNNIFNLPVNLKNNLPIIYYCILIGCLSLLGFPGFAGFYSNNLIFTMLESSELPGAHIAYYLLIITNFITSVYISRLFFIIFYQHKFNNYANHHEHRNLSISSAYLTSKAINIIIIALAWLTCILGGCLTILILKQVMHLNSIEQICNILFHWCINKAELSSLLGILVTLFLYIYKPNFLMWLQIKLNKQFILFENLCKQQYFINNINNMINKFFIWLGNLLFKLIEEQFFNKYLDFNLINLGTYISQHIHNLHVRNLNYDILIMLSGSIIILLWLIVRTF